MQKYIALIVVMIMISGCHDMQVMMFKPASLDLTPPPGPPEYQQGWSDGCETGLASYTNPLPKTFKTWQPKQDWRYINSKMYYQVWKDAFLYCSIYMEAVNKFLI